MNVLNNENSLVHTTPFIKFGLDNSDLVAVTGNVPIRNHIEMHTRLDRAPYNQDLGDDSGSGLTDAAKVGIIVGAALTIIYGMLALLFYVRCLCHMKYSNADKRCPEESAV